MELRAGNLIVSNRSFWRLILVVVLGLFVSAPLYGAAKKATGKSEAKSRGSESRQGAVCVIGSKVRFSAKTKGRGRKSVLRMGAVVGFLEDMGRELRVVNKVGKVGFVKKSRTMKACQWKVPDEKFAAIFADLTPSNDDAAVKKETSNGEVMATTTTVAPESVGMEGMGAVPGGGALATKSVKSSSSESSRVVNRKKPKLAVNDVVILVEGMDVLVGESLSSVLSAEINMRMGDSYDIIARSNLKRVLQLQAENQLMGCTTPKCAIDIATMLEAEKVVTSSVTQFEDKFVFEMQLVDAQTGKASSQVNVSWLGEQGGLVDLIRPYVAKLFLGTKAEGYLGAAEVLANEKGALIFLDEKELGESPLEGEIKGLAIGKHNLKLNKEGYLPINLDFVINHNETTLLQLQLVDEDSLKPWYAKWWFWTGTAAVVGGAILTAVMLRDEPVTTIDIETPLPSALQFR